MNTVLFITSSKMRNWKGTERFIYYLCTELTKLDIHTVIMENSSFRYKEPEIAFNANPQIEIISVPFKKIFGIYCPPRNEINRINPDVVYVSFLNSMPFIPNYRYTTIFGMHILHLGHLKYESLFKNFIFSIKRETLKFLSKLFWRRKKIIFHSLTLEQADWVKRLTGGKFNSVTIPLIIPCSRDYKKLNANDTFNILYFGSLSHEKGFDKFLILLKKLNNSAFAKDLKFNVAGAGIYESNLRQIMEKRSNIEFIKRPDDDVKFKLFSRSDLFLYPSLTDVYPTVLAETQIFGVPAIVSDVSRPSHIVKEGETGYSLSLNDLDSFIRKTEEFYYLWKKDPKNYEKMKDHIRELSKRLCSDNVIPMYNEMFENLLK